MRLTILQCSKSEHILELAHWLYIQSSISSEAQSQEYRMLHMQKRSSSTSYKIQQNI